MAIGKVLDETILIIDTNIFSDYQRRTPLVESKIRDYQKKHKTLPYLSAITVFEVFNGIESELANYRKHKKDITQLEQSYKATKNFIDNFDTIIEFNNIAAQISAYIFANIGRSKANELRNDIHIVATALAFSYGVATRNWKDFEEISKHLPEEFSLLRLAHWKY